MFENAIPSCIQNYIGAPNMYTSTWPLLNSPLSLGSILGTYFTVLVILRKLMRNRRPFVLRKVLILYNACQVLYSGYICKEVFVSSRLAKYRFSCTPLNIEGKYGMRMATAFWLFYLSKIFDLTDTIFFVLRKKSKQITFLHVYHHSSMVFNWYLGVLYSPGGQAFFSVLCNSFVHVIMYLYYMLSAMGPKVQKYLWWKRYLTQLQLIQFIVVMSHLFVGLYNRCRAPFWLNCFTITYLTTLVMLFSNFYYKAYKLKTGKTPKLKKRSSIDYQAGGDFKHR